MALPTFSVDDFRRAYLALLPTGPIWSRDPDGLPYKLAGILASPFVRNVEAANGLITDAFPSTALRLLPEWEETLSLPDPCAGEAPTIAQRQNQVVARLTDAGGCSAAYLIAYAATLGYAITITEFAPFRFGQAFGQPMYGEAWAYAWQVNCPLFTIQPFLFGAGRFGDPFATWGNAVLHCELARLAPAHTIMLFGYDGQPAIGSGSFLTDPEGDVITDPEGDPISA